jgi:hypothetical protein
MKRKPVVVVILTLVALSCYFLWAFRSVREGFDPENEFANWQPTADVVRKQLPSGTRQEREKAFIQLFQSRFRNHEPGKAIGLRFAADGRLHLLTPARLEPWHIDRIAIMLYREVKQDFNKTYDIDIYETFIGTTPVKIAELRASSKSPEQVTVVYHYPVGGAIIMKRNPPPSVRPYPTGFSGVVMPRKPM